jgi:hypothetical protein
MSGYVPSNIMIKVLAKVCKTPNLYINAMYQYDEIGKGVQSRYNKPMCLLNAIKTMVLFEVLLLKNHFFIKRNFQMKYCNLLFILFIVANMHMFFEIRIRVDMNFFKCTDFTRFCVSS